MNPRIWAAFGSAIALGIVPSDSIAQDFSKVFREIDRLAVHGRFGQFAADNGALTTSNEDSWNKFGHSGIGIELGYNITEPGSSRFVFFEGGIGYSQLGGFRLDRNDIELRGTVRELPSISLYAIKDARIFAGKFFSFVPYGGVSSGLIRLQNAVVYDGAGNQFNVASDAFSLGASAGLAFGPREYSPYFEVGYRVRDFQSLEYKQGGTTQVPLGWPRSMNFSGWHVDIGIQVGLSDLKPKPRQEPPKPACCCSCPATTDSSGKNNQR